MGKRKQPVFIVIGAMKAGTTALQGMLRRHPSIYIPRRVKSGEPHFFDRRYDRGWAWYSELFDVARNRVGGEKTPNYVAVPKAMRRIREHLPDVRLIMLVRDPVLRFASHKAHWDRLTRKRRTMKTFLSSRMGKVALWKGQYADQIEYVWELFPREQLLVLLNEDLRTRPCTALTRVHGHIGVELRPQDASSNKPERRAFGGEHARWVEAYYESHNERLAAMLDEPRILQWRGVGSGSDE